MKQHRGTAIISLFIFIFGASTITFAQRYGVTTFKLGYFNPKDAKGGLILSGIFSSAIDEAVDVGLGIDFFRATNKKETQIGESTSGETKETIWRLDSESSSTMLPITALINVKIPATYTLFYTFGGGIGYEMLWTKEVKYESGAKGEPQSKFYHGFKWTLNAGVLYQLGSRSSLILEAFYDNCNVGRKQDIYTIKVNTSGFGFRAGIRMGIL